MATGRPTGPGRQRASENRHTTLFIGGFDSADHVDDYSRDSECLMMFAHRMNIAEAELVRPIIDIKPT